MACLASEGQRGVAMQHLDSQKPKFGAVLPRGGKVTLVVNLARR